MNNVHREFLIEVASEQHYHFASLITLTVQESAKARGTGVSKRTPETIMSYMQQGHALVATDSNLYAGLRIKIDDCERSKEMV